VPHRYLAIKEEGVAMIRINRRLLMIMMGIGITSPILANAQFRNNPGAVFVMTNDAGKNEVIAYGRSSYGTLQGEERYLTGGRGLP
jgi:6-phosphogluconolactonase